MTRQPGPFRLLKLKLCGPPGDHQLMPHTPSEMSALLAAIATVLTALTGLIIAVFVQARRAKTEADDAKADRVKTQEVLGEVKEQVANTHPTNLRDDIDNLTALIERLSVSQSDMKAVVHRLDSTTEAIRGEARDERARVGRIEAEAHDTHSDLYRLIRDIKKEQ